uniref:CMP/dCMP-type deaminase domain-containing protein n=1 Tax=Syphacia muris TaxID=451379 RepID=A0A158R674_9BILA
MFADDNEATSSSLISDPPKSKKPKQRISHFINVSFRFNVSPILRKEICLETVPLEEFYIIIVEVPAIIGKVLSALPPLSNNYSHLKRVKNGRILVQPLSSHLPVNFIEQLCTQHHLPTDGLSLSTTLVPKVKPISNKQFQWAKSYWPTSFHCNKTLESLLNGTFMEDEEKKKIISFFLEAEKVGNRKCGCVIVDRAGLVVAKGGEETTPLGHAVMNAVSALCKSHCAQGSDVVQYLGTGFDVFVTDEPCAMCAMALVHFRVGRVFFNKKNEKEGALESVWRIQEEQRLNHQYSVFRIDEVF